MRAARWYGPHDVRLEHAEPAPVAPDEAVVAVHWTGLCGSDAEEFLEGPVVATAPRVLGHEISGVVHTAATDGSGPAAGTRVVVDVVTGCGHCHWCTHHEEGQCAELVVTGQHRDGGLAELVSARADRLIRVPDTVTLQHAALAEPLAVAVRAMRKAGDVAGHGVLVVGGGAIGLLTAQVARAVGADPVMVIEPNSARRDIARSLGIAAVWSDTAAGRMQHVARAFGDVGARVVVECSGRSGVVAEAIASAGKRATIVLLGVLPRPEPIDTLGIVLGEKTVVGSSAHMWDDDVAVAVGMLANGSVDVAPLITDEFDLDHIDAAFRQLTAPGSTAIKILVRVASETG